VRRKGAASVELLIALPFVLVAIQGMLWLFGVNFARQRTYAALPELARRHAGSEGTSLDAAEERACRAAGYAPPRELRRVAFKTATEAPPFPMVGGPVRIRASYSEIRLR